MFSTLSQTRPDEVRLTHIATTFDHVAFTCTDRPEMEARLKQHNIEFPRGQVPSMGIAQLFLKTRQGMAWN